MLNYIIIKKDLRFEYRLYIENCDNFEGQIIYSGHKNAISQNFLINLLEFKLERTNNKIYFLDYESDDRWFLGLKTNPSDAIQKSYESLQNLLEKRIGKYRKIIITRV